MTLDPKTQIMVRKHAKLEYKGSCYCEKEPVKLLKNIKTWAFFKSPQKGKVVRLFKLLIKHKIFCTDLLFSLETVTEM